jgi:hypothetical protein
VRQHPHFTLNGVWLGITALAAAASIKGVDRELLRQLTGQRDVKLMIAESSTDNDEGRALAGPLVCDTCSIRGLDALHLVISSSASRDQRPVTATRTRSDLGMVHVTTSRSASCTSSSTGSSLETATGTEIHRETPGTEARQARPDDLQHANAYGRPMTATAQRLAFATSGMPSR